MTEINNTNEPETDIQTFDDLVFEKRNKAYGSYDLRKKYKKTVLFAFMISFLVIGTVVAVPLIEAYNAKSTSTVRKTTTVTANLKDLKQEDKPLDIPPPPPAQKALEQEVKFTPKVVEEADTNVTIATTSQQILTSGSDVPPPNIEVTAPEEEKEIEIEEKPFMVVEQKATFQGGDINQFHAWVQEQLQYPEQALQLGSEGLVVVQFTVNSKGIVCDAKILKSTGFSFLDNEAIRAILNSPRWAPARQSGRDVGQLFNLPVQFKIQK